ncbi:hypothetical protein FD755_014873 [Muntiacus reevesi]|uniref:Thioredoxin domain-containing protein n=1 Tax=Muntiacus reevesi TaxID=9886 RepID=A0A5N3XIZ0_MUNRE|nr:hypothetical protein FD755_014873 [Muntiacus reevesi]
MTSNLQLQKQDELKAFLKAAGNKLVVIEFSAKWCGPCKRIYPVFHENIGRTLFHVNFSNIFWDPSSKNKLPPILQSYYQKKSLIGPDAMVLVF